MEFSKDNSVLKLLPDNINIYDTNNNIIISSNGKIKIEKNEFSYNTWYDYINNVNKNTYQGTKGSVDLEIIGGNISLGNPTNPNFSGRFKHPSVEFDADNNNEDFITSKFIGTQNTVVGNVNNAIRRYSGLEIKTDYYNNENVSYWDENVNILTTKFSSVNNTNFNSAGNITCSFACRDPIDLNNNERFGALVINPPNPRLIKTYADSQAFSYQLYEDYITVANMKISQNYIPSNSLEVHNGNISMTSYFNSNTGNNANSYNNSNYAVSTTLNKSTITGLNQVIYDSNGNGNFDFKWGCGIGSFLNYGRGYYEFPEDQLDSWSGNGNKELGTSSYNYSSMTTKDKQTYRRKILNNVIMSGMIIENHFDKNMRFTDDQEYSTFVNDNYDIYPGNENPNLFGTDIENKQPPNESIHFVTYNNKEVLLDNITNPQVPVDRLYNKVWQGEKIYNGENGTVSQDLLPNAQQKTYGGEIRMTITSEGTVGIGTVNKNIQLEVAEGSKFNQTTDCGSGYYFGVKAQFVQGKGNISESNKTAYEGYYSVGNLIINSKFNGIILATALLVNSDHRIKTDIEDVPDKLALKQINQLETKYYNYKDPLKKRKEKVIGFIAQETKKVIPNAVNIVNEYIPDELRIVDTIFEYENNKWKFTIDDIKFEDNHTGKCKFIFKKNTIIKTEYITVESDKKTFFVNNKYNEVFLWGKEVNDFHTIDKNMIFALHHSGIQELSKENDIKQEKITALENEISELKNRIKVIEEKLGL